MASINYGTNNADLVNAATLARRAWKLITDRVDIRNTCLRVPDTAGSGSLAVKIPQTLWNDTMAAPGEVTQTSNTTLEDAAVTVTAARQTLRYDKSDEFLIAGGRGADDPDLVDGLHQGYTRRASALICDVIDGFTDTAGGTGLKLTVDHIYDADFELQKNEIPDSRAYCVLDPKGFTDFVDSLRGEPGAAQFEPATADMLALKGQGYKGSWHGIDFTVPSATQVKTSSSDKVGALYTMGAVALLEMSCGVMRNMMPDNQWLALSPPEAAMWIEKVRGFNGASYGYTTYIAAAMIGVAMNEDARGVSITYVAT